MTTVARSNLEVAAVRTSIGNLKHLTRDIAELGLQVYPAAVQLPGEDRYRLVGGNRRAEAWHRAHGEPIKVYVVTSWDDFMHWMKLDEAEQSRYANRLAALGPGVGITTPEPRPWNLVEGYRFCARLGGSIRIPRLAKPDVVLGTYLGLPADQIQEVRSVARWLASENDPTTRQELQDGLDEVARGEVRAGSVFSRVRQNVTRRAQPVRSAAEQGRMMGAIVDTFGGASRALDSLGPLAADLDPAALETFAKALTTMRGAIDKAQRNLRKAAGK